jgi:sialate O-acetylesterase
MQSNKILHGGTCIMAVLLFGCSSRIHADVTLAPLFRDHAVLQRDKPVPIWGKAGPGEKVSVSFNRQTQTAVTDDRGRWRVQLAAMPASSVPAKLTVRGKNTLTIQNVLVGEVWLCSGQSNMEWLVKDSLNAGQEIAAADFPQIRHFRVPHVAAVSPQDDCGSTWTVCSPASAGAYSAAAYYFGRELYRRLGVPIGLVNSSWGGTQIEPWMSPAGLAGDPAGPEVDKRWQEEMQALPAKRAAYEKALAQWNTDAAEAKKNGRVFKIRKPSEPLGIGSRQQPTALYNAMIAPLVPYAIRGVIWYQGEANASRYIEYRTLFPSMIRQWRRDFGQGDFPFYYVQLANHRPRKHWAFLREAQEYALQLPATGQAVAIDIGESNGIHPKNKQEVGRRLALNAFATTYGLKIEHSGPRYAGMAVEQDKVRLRFTHAEGLKTKDPAMPGFEIAGDNKKFVPASASIDGETVVVSAGEIKNPVAVRYAWASDPPAPLYNAADLPASPFRTDNWDE